MVDLDLIVQRQGMVAHPPVVADPGIFIDDERIDAQLAQAGGHGEAVLAAADHQDRRIAVGEGARLVALVQPVQAAEIA